MSYRLFLPKSVFRILGLLVILVLVVLAPALTKSDAAQRTQVFVRYVIDRSDVPAWVSRHELTLRIEVHNADTVRIWADGRPHPVRYDPLSRTVVVTTSAQELLLAAEGEGLNPDNVGAFRVATLKDNKLWAYSLTFDDGRLNVYENALPELARYGLRAGVALIGEWLDRTDYYTWGYCGPQELSALVAAGWGMYNHAYRSSVDPGSITFENAYRCQEAAQRVLGYRIIAFTTPSTEPAWLTLIDNNAEALGLYITQHNNNIDGFPGRKVDNPITVGGPTFHLGRMDVGTWLRNGVDYWFSQAHLAAQRNPPEHRWISLHAHEVEYGKDWCSVLQSTAHVYNKYGPGGTDEVWIAPVDEIFQYLVLRSYARVSRAEGAPRELGPEVKADTRLLYQPGVAGNAAWGDTHIHQSFPTTNYGRNAEMVLRKSTGNSAILLKVAPEAPDPNARVLHATLSLHATNYTNPQAILGLVAFPLLRAWDPTQATWQSASAGVRWGLAGARLVNVDREANHLAPVPAGGCVDDDDRWYTFDVTELVRAWLADPSSNYGIIIEGDDGEVSKEIRFASSEHPYLDLRPKLSVLYGWPAPALTPTPTPSPNATPTATPTPRPATITGYVWEDANRNQDRDPGEVPLHNVLIELRSGDHTILRDVRTDGVGEFVFANLAAGLYVVVEHDPVGYASSTSNIITVTLSSGQVEHVTFGDYPLPVCDPVCRYYLPLITR